MENFVIAAQLFTLRDLLKDQSEEQVKDTLRAVKEMGYDAVQVSGIGVITQELAKTYKALCEAIGLEICATHTSLEDYEENIEWIIEYHKAWGCTYAGIGSMPLESRSAKGLEDFAKRCNHVGAKLLEAGITLVYHNHKFEYEKVDGRSFMEILFDLFDPRFVEFELDTHWVQAGGANPVTWINKVDQRMSVVHFKDFRIVNDERRFAEVGMGNLEWPLIIEACRKTGVKYAAVEQDSHTDDPLESLRISRDYLKTIM